ncbi:MAG: A24 family peptidase [Bacteroidota bacterium]
MLGGFAYGGLAFHLGHLASPYALALVVCTFAAAIDLRTYRIPNGLNAVGVAMALIWLSSTDVTRVPDTLFAAGVVGGSLTLLSIGLAAWRGQVAFGMGDVKLLVVMALFFGWAAVGMLYIAIVLCAVAGLVLRLTKRLHKGDRLPFAPFIALSCVAHGLGIRPEQLLMHYG